MLRSGEGNSQTTRLSGATSIRRLLRRSAITIGQGSGLPHDATGVCSVPVAGGGGRNATPLETMPAPRISAVTVTGLPSGSAAGAASARTEHSAAMGQDRMFLASESDRRRHANRRSPPDTSIGMDVSSGPNDRIGISRPFSASRFDPDQRFPTVKPAGGPDPVHPALAEVAR